MYDNHLWKILTGNGLIKPSEHLDYFTNDPVSNIFFMKDGTIAFAFNIKPVSVYDVSLIKAIDSVLGLPDLLDNDSFQIINFTKAGASKVVLTFRSSGYDVSQALEDISLSNIAKNSIGLKQRFDFKAERAKETGRVVNLKEEIMNIIESSNMAFSELDQDDLKQFYYNIMGIENVTECKKGVFVPGNLFSNEVCADLEDELYIKTSNSVINVISIKNYPENMLPVDTSGVLGILKQEYQNNIPAALTCLNIRVRSNKSLIEIIDKKIKGYDRDKHIKFISDGIEKLQKLIDYINEGHNVLEGYMSLFSIYNPKNKPFKDNQVSSLFSIILGSGYIPQNETILKFPMLFSALPMN